MEKHSSLKRNQEFASCLIKTEEEIIGEDMRQIQTADQEDRMHLKPNTKKRQYALEFCKIMGLNDGLADTSIISYDQLEKSLENGGKWLDENWGNILRAYDTAMSKPETWTVDTLIDAFRISSQSLLGFLSSSPKSPTRKRQMRRKNTN
jgi:hypothetical protein